MGNVREDFARATGRGLRESWVPSNEELQQLYIEACDLEDAFQKILWSSNDGNLDLRSAWTAARDAKEAFERYIGDLRVPY